MSTNKSTWKKLTSMRLFMPLVCLLAIIIVATITIPGFLSMSLKNGVPYGYPVDVINRASELVILSVGMTLVTAASGGQDISVGAVMAVAGAVCCQILSGGEVSVNSLSAPIIVAFLAALVASGICGAFNGFLVAKLNIQPMVATLISRTWYRPADHRRTDYIYPCEILSGIRKLCRKIPDSDASCNCNYRSYHCICYFEKDSSWTLYRERWY